MSPYADTTLLSSIENFRKQIERLIRSWFAPIIRLLIRFGISPNGVSVTGFAVTLLAVGCFISGAAAVAGLIFLLGSLFDILDGELARATNASSKFGAVIDSLLDRISEGVILIAIAWYFADRGEVLGVVITMSGLLGSLSTSYVRARAEAAGTTCTVGLITRPERIVILSLGMIFDQLYPAVIALLVLTTLTVLQRLFHVYRILRKEN